MRRGYTLVGFLAAIALMAMMHFSLQASFNRAHHRLAQHKHAEAARWMAISGLDCAKVRLKSGQWKAPKQFESPPFQSGFFRVTVVADGGGWRVTSEGYAGRRRVRLEERVAR